MAVFWSAPFARERPSWTPDRPRARWQRRDFFLRAYIPAVAALAWCLAERLGWPLCRGLARVSLFLRRNAATCHRARSGLIGDHRLAVDMHELARANLADNHLLRLQGMRSYAPHGWRPQIRLVGRGHIERALAAGRGAALWIAPMACKDLIAKVALHQAGYQVSHLSRFDHGFSTSLWGARPLNPVWAQIENRFLAERLVMAPGVQLNPLRVLIKRLRENRLVSVTASTEERRLPRRFPFLNGRIALAEGAASLSVTTGAALHRAPARCRFDRAHRGRWIRDHPAGSARRCRRRARRLPERVAEPVPCKRQPLQIGASAGIGL